MKREELARLCKMGKGGRGKRKERGGKKEGRRAISHRGTEMEEGVAKRSKVWGGGWRKERDRGRGEKPTKGSR